MKLLMRFVVPFLGLIACVPLAYAQYENPTTPSSEEGSATHADAAFSRQELDQMLAPIALYPDQLLSQILMAATYPLEVVEAARWSKANPNLKGEEAVRAVREKDWDPSVKSLVAFPQILHVMDEKLDWTERLGDAFLGQEEQVMDTVQKLRQKAYAAGNLKSDNEMQVAHDGDALALQPAKPDVVYVPYYDPTVVYGPWWWPDYPPIFWAPWPGYYYIGPPVFAWGVAIIITTGFFFGNCDWHHHHVNIVNSISNVFLPPPPPPGVGHPPHGPRPIVHAPGPWHHDPYHRRGVPYRDLALAREFGRTSATSGTHREFRGYNQPAMGERERINRLNESGRPPSVPIAPGAEPRHEERGPVAPQPHRETPPQTERPSVRPSQPRSFAEPRPEPRPFSPPRPEPAPFTPSRPETRPFIPPSPQPRPFIQPRPEPRPPALEDIGHGQSVRDYSLRGRSSFQGSVFRPTVIPEQRPGGGIPPGNPRHPR